ncbi:MAG: radical SAM protein, partial [Betaproteobacteria bacterium]
LVPMAADGLVAVAVSIPTLDHDLSRKLEPRAARPARRLRPVQTLARAGVPTVVNFALVIPFIHEPELDQVLTAARDAGAVGGFYTVLRLPWEVNPLFQQWLADHLPLRAERVMARVREMRGGRDYDADFKTRMKGEGLWAKLIRDRFDKTCARLGLSRQAPALRTDLFQPPAPATPQLSLL